jgi:hypothetical protein
MIPTKLNDTAFDCIELDSTLKKRVRQAVKPATADCEWDDGKLYINGELYFDEARYYKNDDYVLDDGTWTYTYFEIEYPISTLIAQFTDIAEKAVDKLGVGDEDTDETSDSNEDSDNRLDSGSDKSAQTDDEDDEEDVNNSKTENNEIVV